MAYGSSPSLDAPDYAKGKVNLGYSYQINMEKLIGEKPDLVIDEFTERYILPPLRGRFAPKLAELKAAGE